MAQPLTGYVSPAASQPLQADRLQAALVHALDLTRGRSLCRQRARGPQRGGGSAAEGGAVHQQISQRARRCDLSSAASRATHPLPQLQAHAGECTALPVAASSSEISAFFLVMTTWRMAVLQNLAKRLQPIPSFLWCFPWSSHIEGARKVVGSLGN